MNGCKENLPLYRTLSPIGAAAQKWQRKASGCWARQNACFTPVAQKESMHAQLVKCMLLSLVINQFISNVKENGPTGRIKCNVSSSIISCKNERSDERMNTAQFFFRPIVVIKHHLKEKIDLSELPLYQL